MFSLTVETCQMLMSNSTKRLAYCHDPGRRLSLCFVVVCLCVWFRLAITTTHAATAAPARVEGSPCPARASARPTWMDAEPRPRRRGRRGAGHCRRRALKLGRRVIGRPLRHGLRSDGSGVLSMFVKPKNKSTIRTATWIPLLFPFLQI